MSFADFREQAVSFQVQLPEKSSIRNDENFARREWTFTALRSKMPEQPRVVLVRAVKMCGIF